MFCEIECRFETVKEMLIYTMRAIYLVAPRADSMPAISPFCFKNLLPR